MPTNYLSLASRARTIFLFFSFFAYFLNVHNDISCFYRQKNKRLLLKVDSKSTAVLKF